jgi:hypothetical protein
MEKETKNRQLGTGFFVQHRIVSTVKRVELFSDRTSYIVLRGRWCNIILNVQALTEEKSDDSEDNFYEELERVFDRFPKYHIKILLEEFNTKVGRQNIFKPTIWKESIPPQKIWFLRARISRAETFISTPGPFLRRRLTTRSITYW